MGMFANLRVGTRLGAGFGLALMLTLAVGGLGQYAQRTVGEITDQITSRDTVKTEILYQIMLNNQEGANSLLKMFQAKDPEEVKRIIDARSGSTSVSNDRYKLLADLTVTQEGKALLADLVESRKVYTPVRAKTIALLVDGKRDEALKLWNTQGEAVLAAFRKQLDNNLKFIKQRVANGTGQIAQTNQSSNVMVLATSVLALLLLGAANAFLITRSLRKQLGGEPAYAAEITNKVAAGDLSVIVAIKADDTTSLLAGLKNMNENLKKIVGEVRNGTDSIATASQQIAAGNADLSQRTEAQASSLEETASSMEELTSTVKRNAENAKQANQLAASASAVAVKGGTVVGQVVTTMRSINESSKKVVDIISVIDGIAFQTNILALNAAVEAARAGEQGRGFAVVATEVRMLAQRSAAAAKEIKELISDSVHKVEDGTKLVDEAGKTMDEIVSSVKRVTDIMGEIAAASHEQSSGIEQVNQAVTQMDEATQQNAALVEEAAAASASMLEQAHNLTQAVAVFKLADRQPTPQAAPRQPEAAMRQLTPRAKARPQAPARASAARTAPARARTGTDGEWSEF